MRFLENSWDRGPFHGLLNVIEKAGEITTLHKHPRDHLLVTNSALKVDAMVSGSPVVVECGPSDWFMFWLIRAGVEHKITALQDDTRFICLFSHYDANGRYLPDPKV